MTIRVKIEHTQEGYDRAITVETVGLTGTGELVPNTQYPQKVVIQPGQSGQWFYVHGSQALVVTEGPAATKEVTDDTRPSDVN